MPARMPAWQVWRLAPQRALEDHPYVDEGGEEGLAGVDVVEAGGGGEGAEAAGEDDVVVEERAELEDYWD